MLFFVSVGMLIDPAYLLNNLVEVLLLVLFVIIGKGLIFGILVRFFGYYNIIPIAVGLGLSQIGEFSFVLARVGLNTNSISENLYALILSASVMTMIMTPFLASLTAPIYKIRKRMFKHEPVQTINIPDRGLRNHVIIAGGGRVGQNIAKALHHLNIPFLIIELDSHRISHLKNTGNPVVFGDASQQIVLEAASVEHSRLMLITTPAVIITQTITRLCRNLNPELCIIARCGEEEQMKILHDLGVNEVVLPEFEAGLEITRQAFQRLGVPPMKILEFTNQLRHGVYNPERETDQDYRMLSQLRRVSDLLELTWISVNKESPLIGNTVKTLEIRKNMGVSIVGVVHGRDVLANPDLDYRFALNDLLAVMGNPQQLSSFQAFNNHIEQGSLENQ